MARPSPGVERTVALITFLTRHPARSFGVSELSRRLDLNKATVHSMVNALAGAGWLRRDPVDKTYRLGPGLIAVGAAATGSDAQLLERARPTLRDVSDELDLQIVASVVMDEEMVVLAVEGPATTGLSFNTRPGDRVPLTPPYGTVFLAWADPAQIRRWLRRLDPGLDDAQLELYRHALEVVRDRGYAVSLRQGAHPGLSGAGPSSTGTGDRSGGDHLGGIPGARLVPPDYPEDYLVLEVGSVATYEVAMMSAPVFDTRGQVAMAISFTGFATPLTADQLPIYGQRLLDLTEGLTATIGGHPATPAHT